MQPWGRVSGSIQGYANTERRFHLSTPLPSPEFAWPLGTWTVDWLTKLGFLVFPQRDPAFWEGLFPRRAAPMLTDEELADMIG